MAPRLGLRVKLGHVALGIAQEVHPEPGVIVLLAGQEFPAIQLELLENIAFGLLTIQLPLGDRVDAAVRRLADRFLGLVPILQDVVLLLDHLQTIFQLVYLSLQLLELVVLLVDVLHQLIILLLFRVDLCLLVCDKLSQLLNLVLKLLDGLLLNLVLLRFYLRLRIV